MKGTIKHFKDCNQKKMACKNKQFILVPPPAYFPQLCRNAVSSLSIFREESVQYAVSGMGRTGWRLLVTHVMQTLASCVTLGGTEYC